MTQDQIENAAALIQQRRLDLNVKALITDEPTSPEAITISYEGGRQVTIALTIDEAQAIEQRVMIILCERINDAEADLEALGVEV